jgi:ribosomal protein L11 methyltransferase
VTVAVTVLRVPAEAAELAADRLMAAGAFGVEERTADDGGIELRADLGDDSGVVRRRLEGTPSAWHWHIELVDAVALDTWRDHATPIRIAPDLVIRPAWLSPLDEPGVVELVIEPGRAFGLGDHPTTRLSAAAVWRAVQRGDTLLDVGCGTAALAIVGLLGGAGHAVAIDVAEPAVVAARDNAGRNGLADRIDASTTPLCEVAGEFQLVVANILAPTLVALADDLRRCTAPSGRLIVSGVLAGAFDHVVAALRPMRVDTVTELDGWAALELTHRRQH